MKTFYVGKHRIEKTLIVVVCKKIVNRRKKAVKSAHIQTYHGMSEKCQAQAYS